MVFEDIGKDINVVNKSSTIFPILFQYTVYKILYINWKVCKTYKNDFKTLYIILVDKDEPIFINQINKELEEEVGYIDNNDIFFIINRIDNILLQ